MRYRAATKKSPEFTERERGRFFGRSTLVVFWIFVVAACVAVTIPAIPQYRLLKKIEGELEAVRNEEERLREKSLRLEAEARALKNNPRYLEARARDPLRSQLNGETVVQFGD